MIYRKSVKEVMSKIAKKVEEDNEGCILTGCDFNSSSGEDGGPIRKGIELEEKLRTSRDRTITKEGAKFIEILTERGWMILNGSFDKVGDWTFIGETGQSVTDYIVTNGEAKEKVTLVHEGDVEESDHLRIETYIRGPATTRKEKEKRNLRKKQVVRRIWIEAAGVKHL